MRRGTGQRKCRIQDSTRDHSPNRFDPLYPGTEELYYSWLWIECRHERATGRILMGGKGNCPFLGALFGRVEMSAGARSGYGARLGFWDSGMAFEEE